MANTTYLDRPVFGGNTGGRAAYSTPAAGDIGGTYEGDDGIALRTVAAGTQVEVSVTGPQAFGDGTDDQLFDVLNGLAAQLRGVPGDAGGVTDLSDGLSKLDRAVDRLIGVVGKVGARLNRVEAMKATAEDSLVTLTNSLSEVESIDLPKTIMDLQMQEVAYKAALGATARVVQPSGAVKRTVAAGTQVEVNVTGPETFGDGTDAQLFDVLAGLSAQLRGGPPVAGVTEPRRRPHQARPRLRAHRRRRSARSAPASTGSRR